MQLAALFHEPRKEKREGVVGQVQGWSGFLRVGCRHVRICREKMVEREAGRGIPKINETRLAGRGEHTGKLNFARG